MNEEELERWIREADEADFLVGSDECTGQQPTTTADSEINDPPLDTGTEIDGYRIVSVVGRGGRGIVYRAQQLQVANRDVAIKVYHVDRSAKTPVVSVPEVRALASIDHPHLARILDAGTTANGNTYVVMKLLTGTRLDEHCRQNTLTANQIAGLVATAANAVEHLHQNGLIHCDIKPANIIVDEAGKPTVTDFDSAQWLGRDHVRIRGTLGFQAPEQSNGAKEPLSPATDVYAFGATLYALLTGYAPFADRTPSGQAIATLLEEPAKPSELAGDVPASLDRICLRCLRKSPEERYQTAAEFANELIKTHSASTPPRKRVMASISAGLAIAMVVTLGFAFRYQGHTNGTHIVGSTHSLLQWQATEAESEFALLVSQPTHGTPRFLETRDPRPGFMFARRSPDGRRIAVMGNDHWIRIFSFDETLGELIAMLPMDRPDDSTARSISWHPDSNRLVACANDNCAIIWDVELAKRLTRLRTNAEFNFVHDVQYSPDGSRVAAALDSGVIQIWDESGATVGKYQQHDAAVSRVRWSPDGSQLASTDQTGEVHVWNANDLHVVKRFTPASQSEIAAPVRALQWHPNGQHLFAGNDNGAVHRIDVVAGEVTELARMQGTVRALDWSTDGRQLAIAGDSVAVFSDADGLTILDPQNSDGTTGSVQWNADDSSVLVAGRQRQLRSWDVTGGSSRLLGDSNVARVLNMQPSPDRRWLASTDSAGYVRLFDPSGRVVATSPHSPSADGIEGLAWHPDSTMLAVGNDFDGIGVEVYQINSPAAVEGIRASESEAPSFKSIARLPFEKAVAGVAWNPKGDRLVVGDFSGKLSVFETARWSKLEQPARHESSITDIAINSKGLVATGDRTGQLNTWEMRPDGKLVPFSHRKFTSGIKDLAFDSTGGRLAVSEFRKHVFLVDSQSLEDLWLHPSPAPARPGKLCWSDDDRQIACGLYGILDAANGKLVDVRSCVNGACVSWQSSGLMVTGSWQGKVEFRRPPDYKLFHRVVQWTGGNNIPLPPGGQLPSLPSDLRDHLRWISEPRPGQFRLHRLSPQDRNQSKDAP